MKIGIIGAGMAGAACGQALTSRGHTVTLFDKGRGPGGRMSTRRVSAPQGELRFDHGAQYVTARSEGFAAALGTWRTAGHCAVWDARFVGLGAETRAVTPSSPRWVGAPSMNGLVRAALTGLDVRFGARVSQTLGRGGAWRLVFEDGAEAGPFDAVVCATPAEQAVDLLGSIAPQQAREAAAARSQPCWSVMAHFAEDRDLGFDAGAVDAGPLAWVARESSKPGRAATGGWVLHATADWSRRHLEDPADDVADTLVQAFGSLSGLGDPNWAHAHRWRFAQVDQPASSPFSWDASLAVGACGDWRIGPRVEAAWTSGDQLGRAMAAALS